MSHICNVYVIDPKEVGKKSFYTVDRFYSMVELLHNSIIGESEGIADRYAACSAVMKELSSSPKDICNLLNNLERITMAIAHQCILRLKPNPENTINHQTFIKPEHKHIVFERTFTRSRMYHIMQMNWMLETKIKKHKTILDTIIFNQEKMTKILKDRSWSDSKIPSYAKLLPLTDTVVNFSPGQLNSKILGLRAKSQILRERHRKMGECLGSILTKEKFLREEITGISDDVYRFSRISIKKKLDRSVRFLRKTIAAVLPSEMGVSFEKMLRKISTADIVDNILIGSSQQYSFPDIESFEETFGADEILPHSFRVTPKEFLSMTSADFVQIQPFKKRVPERFKVVFANGEKQRVLKGNPAYSLLTFKGQAITKTSTVNSKCGLAFGWTLLSNGIRGLFSGKKWGFFYVT